MENSRTVVVPVTLKGVNYLLWSRTTKTALCSRGLWEHVVKSEAPKETVEKDGKKMVVAGDSNKWFQEDQMVLSIIQNSLEASLLEAYSYCESAKELWETLQKVFGNNSNLSRVYEARHTPQLRKLKKTAVKERVESASMTEECNAVEQSMTVPKLEDPGRFELSVQINSTVFPHSLCDTGSGVNIMPYSTAKQLGFNDFSQPKFSLKFADCFVKRPLGVLENVQLLIGGVYVPADFVVLDQPEDPGDPLILGRPFLYTVGAKIDLKTRRVVLQLGDIELKFEMDKLLEKHGTVISTLPKTLIPAGVVIPRDVPPEPP